MVSAAQELRRHHLPVVFAITRRHFGTSGYLKAQRGGRHAAVETKLQIISHPSSGSVFLEYRFMAILKTNSPVYAASQLAYGDKCSSTEDCSGNLACDIASDNGGRGYGYGVQWEAAKAPATEHHCVCPQPGDQRYGEKDKRDLCC